MAYDAIVEEAKSLSFDERASLVAILASTLVGRKGGGKEDVHDCRSTYPKGFWDLFGCDPDFFDEPEELPWKLDAPREQL